MIEIIEGLPDNVVGIIVRGRVTRSDCLDVLAPAIARSCAWRQRPRLYYEIRSRYPGAAWEELNISEIAPLWERIAVVSDVAWFRHAVKALRLFIPSELQAFTSAQAPEALAWISAGQPHQRKPAQSPATASRRPYPPAQYLHNSA